MATVEMLVDDLERGDVPALSVKTGQPCENAVGVVLRVGPALSLLRRRVTVVLPIEQNRVTLHKASVSASWVVLAVFVATLLFSWIVAAVALVVYAALLFAGDILWVSARPGASTDTVVLRGVHPAFAAAVSR